MSAPSYEEFVECVKDAFASANAYLKPEQVEEYFSQEKTQEILKEEYETAKAELAEGKITERIFLKGSATAVGGCLALMY